jgi:hypothetical protein
MPCSVYGVTFYVPSQIATPAGAKVGLAVQPVLWILPTGFLAGDGQHQTTVEAYAAVPSCPTNAAVAAVV